MGKLLLVLLEIVVGLALVGTVATSTNSGSTALAGFSGAQSLVIIVPLIFVAIIIYGAYKHFETSKRGAALYFEGRVQLVLVRLQTRAMRAFLWAVRVSPQK
jgi:hypothetical protein